MTPSTSCPVSSLHRAAISSLARSKSGMKTASWKYVPGWSNQMRRSCSVSGRTGLSSSPNSLAATVSPSATVPSSARSGAIRPGMPPSDRGSALFWKTRR
jgi:hypothetical protein